MKFRNTQNAYVRTGLRDSVYPYGVTRDFTEDEVKQSEDLRNSLAKGYLVEWDGKGPSETPAKKSAFVAAPDTQGGELVRKRSGPGKPVEYITAVDAGGPDYVPNPAPNATVAKPDKGYPVDYIEDGVVASNPPTPAKPGNKRWVNASDAFEAELNAETTTDLVYDDSDTLAEGEGHRGEVQDAAQAIDEDMSRIVRPQGNMGAVEETVAEAIQSATATATASLTKAATPSYDDGERADGASPDASDLLKQPFASKKWLISKTSDAALLKEVAAATRSDNVRSLAQQRLEELRRKG